MNPGTPAEHNLLSAVLTDAHFWVPFLVLLLGLVVLAVCAHS